MKTKRKEFIVKANFNKNLDDVEEVKFVQMKLLMMEIWANDYREELEMDLLNEDFHCFEIQFDKFEMNSFEDNMMMNFAIDFLYFQNNAKIRLKIYMKRKSNESFILE